MSAQEMVEWTFVLEHFQKTCSRAQRRGWEDIGPRV